MNRLCFLVEGDPRDLSNFSGIPHFFTRDLLKCLDEIKIPAETVDTSYLLNVEELVRCMDQLWQGCEIEDLVLGNGKLGFELNQQLFCNLQKHPGYDDSVPVLREYYSNVAEHMHERMEKILRPGDVLLSQNCFYPYMPIRGPIYYSLDSSLVGFYFDDRFGTVPARRLMNNIKLMYTEMEKTALSGARAIFCFSNALKDDLIGRHGLGPEQLIVVGGGANLDEYPGPITRAVGQVLKLLFVGLDFQRKGGDVLLQAMEMLQDDPITLTVVTSREHIPAASTAKSNVVYHPPCQKDRLMELYRDADVFVFPTLFEPFGVVICEALAHSLPVIASKTFAVPEILGSRSPNILVEPGDPAGLVQAIRYLIANPNTRQAIGKYNYLRGKELFRWDHAANRILSSCLMDSVLAQ